MTDHPCVPAIDTTSGRLEVAVYGFLKRVPNKVCTGGPPPEGVDLNIVQTRRYYGRPAPSCNRQGIRAHHRGRT